MYSTSFVSIYISTSPTLSYTFSPPTYLSQIEIRPQTHDQQKTSTEAVEPNRETANKVWHYLEQEASSQVLEVMAPVIQERFCTQSAPPFALLREIRDNTQNMYSSCPEVVEAETMYEKPSFLDWVKKTAVPPKEPNVESSRMLETQRPNIELSRMPDHEIRIQHFLDESYALSQCVHLHKYSYEAVVRSLNSSTGSTVFESRASPSVRITLSHPPWHDGTV